MPQNTFLKFVKLDGIEARGHHDSAVILSYDLILLLIVNGSGLTYLGTDTAFSRLELDAALPVNHRNIGNGLGKGGIDGASVI